MIKLDFKSIGQVLSSYLFDNKVENEKEEWGIVKLIQRLIVKIFPANNMDDVGYIEGEGEDGDFIEDISSEILRGRVEELVEDRDTIGAKADAISLLKDIKHAQSQTDSGKEYLKLDILRERVLTIL